MFSLFRIHRVVFALLLLIVPCETFAASDYRSGETHFYWRDTVEQGRAISGVSMCPGDLLLVKSGTGVSFYTVNIAGNSGTTTERLPYFLAPNTSLSGNTVTGVSMWQLAGFSADAIRARTLVIDQTIRADKILAGVSPWDIGASGVTVDPGVMAGGFVRTWGAAGPLRIGIPLISGTSGFFRLTDYTGSGVTLQTTNGQVLYGSSGTGTAYFLNAGNARGSVSVEIVNTGITTFVNVIGEQGTWHIK